MKLWIAVCGVVAFATWVGGARASTSICTQGMCSGSKSDVMVGTPYNDLIYGDGHDNTLRGRGLYDYLWGYGGQDTLEGGNGRDTLKGGGGEDVLAGNGGNDIINARESDHQRTDWIFCGTGNYDVVKTVPGGVDYIDPDCETVVT